MRLGLGLGLFAPRGKVGVPIDHLSGGTNIKSVSSGGSVLQKQIANGGTSIKTISSAGVTVNWTPLLLPSLKAWYRADQYNPGTGIWTDLSGNGLHATPQVIVSNPTLVTNVINGKSVVRFAATQGLLVPDGVQIELSNKASTVWAVCKTTVTTASYSVLIALGDIHGGYTIMPTTSDSALWAVYAGGKKSTTKDLNTFKQIMVLAPGPNQNAEARTNKVSETIALAGYDTTGAWIGTDGLSGGDNLLGDVAEIVVTHAVVSNANRDLLEAYGSARYAI